MVKAGNEAFLTDVKQVIVTMEMGDATLSQIEEGLRRFNHSEKNITRIQEVLPELFSTKEFEIAVVRGEFGIRACGKLRDWMFSKV